MHPFFEEVFDGAEPSIDDAVDRLGDLLPLLRELRFTRQDPGWHAEGNVHIHTGMVMDEAYAWLRRQDDWSAEQRFELILSALLHDIAKPLCTADNEVRGTMRVTARGHEIMGRSHLAPLLIGQLPYPSLERVLGAVGYHNEPRRLVLRDGKEGDYARVCRSVDPRLVYALELADMRGRISHDRDSQVETIELYRLGAEEHGAFVRGGKWKTEWRDRIADHFHDEKPAMRDLAWGEALRQAEQGKIHSAEEAIAQAYRFRDDFPEVVVMVGLSGSGKSHYVSRHLSDHDVISLDEIREDIGADRGDQRQNDRVLHEARDRLKGALRAKKRVVWDATSIRKDFRKRVASLGFDYGALVSFVVIHAPLDLIRKRNRQRGHAVEESVWSRQLERLQWPELHEAHQTHFVDETGRTLKAYGVLG
ncbi:MAG: AAA family ATPase [Myxococcota bacterium]